MQTSVLDCWFLTGPTASGKTTVGLELAKLLNAEIISLDSMAIYRGMDIGTAKPTHQQRRRVPHHLLDIIAPTGEFSLSQYVDVAHEKIRQISDRGRAVLFVGGTPLYLKSLLRGIFQGPPADWEFREHVYQEVKTVGTRALHDRLRQVDPLSAARLHPSDVRRIVRALEVSKLTGQPISHQQVQFDEGHPAEACKVFVLSWPPDPLRRRIDARVDRMFDAGMVEEVQRLLDRHGALSRTASQAVGYRETIDCLRGTRNLVETVRLLKTRTRQLAKRQRTWFRSLSECRFVPLEEELDPAEVAQRVVDAVERKTRI